MLLNGVIKDTKRNRLYLNLDYIVNELGIEPSLILNDEYDTNNATLPIRVAKYTSNQIYDYLQLNSIDFKYNCERIEKDEEVFESFKTALGYQLMSFIQNGDTNLKNDGDIEKIICVRTKQILNATGLLTTRRPIRGGYVRTC